MTQNSLATATVIQEARKPTRVMARMLLRPNTSARKPHRKLPARANVRNDRTR